MAPTVPIQAQFLRRRAESSQDDALGPISILGIVLIASAFAGLVVWLGWRKWKKGAAFQPEMISESESRARLGPRPHLVNAFDRSRMTASIILPVAAARPFNEKATDDGGHVAYLPPLRQTGSLVRAVPDVPSPPRALSVYSVSAPRRSGLRRSFGPAEAYGRVTMTEHEILDYHLQQGNMPFAFAPIAIDPTREPRISTRDSVTPSVSSMVEKDARTSRESMSSLSNLVPPPKLDAEPRFGSRTSSFHSRLSSLSASIGFPGSSPPTSPVRNMFTFGKKHARQISHLPAPTLENQRSVKIATFQPLLPDELVLKSNELLTVVESYDDGWCIVARMNLGMLEVGAVPEWVFGVAEGEEEAFATMRPMRSTSLGVTVDLRVIEPSQGGNSRPWAESGGGMRDSLISWSNF